MKINLFSNSKCQKIGTKKVVEIWDGEVKICKSFFSVHCILQYLFHKTLTKITQGFKSFTFKQPKVNNRTSSRFLQGQNLMNHVTNCFFILCVIVFVGSIIFVIILCINPFLFLESGYTPWPEFQTFVQ